MKLSIAVIGKFIIFVSFPGIYDKSPEDVDAQFWQPPCKTFHKVTKLSLKPNCDIYIAIVATVLLLILTIFFLLIYLLLPNKACSYLTRFIYSHEMIYFKNCNVEVLISYNIDVLFYSKRDIAATNFVMHEVHCRRNIILCKHCGEPVPRTEVDDHYEEYHIEVACDICNASIEKQKMDDHKVVYLKLTKCEYKFWGYFDWNWTTENKSLDSWTIFQSDCLHCSEKQATLSLI